MREAVDVGQVDLFEKAPGACEFRAEYEVVTPQDEADFWRGVQDTANAKLNGMGHKDALHERLAQVPHSQDERPAIIVWDTLVEVCFWNRWTGMPRAGVMDGDLDRAVEQFVKNAMVGDERPTFRAEPIAPVPSICEQAIALGKLDEDDGLEYDGEFTAGVYRKVFPELFESREAV